MRFLAITAAAIAATPACGFLPAPTGTVPAPSAANAARRTHKPAAVVLAAGFFGGGGGSGGNNNGRDDDDRSVPGGEKISRQRRAQLGINPDEEEYDLGYALEQNTDPVITKVVAGSFILVMIALLVYAVVIPSLTIYDEGVCSPIQNAGRC
mmetsp:Transcript_5759/g.9725  ORF Transcript_5759/g.9725 Transcript_5759/m.9725 type:complete len:152 (-) Transcript_5759:231-686(-)|eukprot:CAMPEP_0197726616 /NCGR_PEP_ID=MMETSP1434-20131217/16443_1 /TAXON_ID=265543 /ORGANISM="Minutocellus polymorphus, Strain CCMP3303" /LENGTH=151 /DNA_ID=CAMNT_0043312603 /DNA_START=97 /DNA_END=552 /DNA_ORIENTATION=-